MVEIDLFEETFCLETADPLSTGPDGPEGQTWRRWLAEVNGLQVALVRSMSTGLWNAYVNFEEMEPTVRRFNFWGKDSETPEEAVKALRESIISASGVLHHVLTGKVQN